MDSKSARWRLVLLVGIFALAVILVWKWNRPANYGPPPTVAVTSGDMPRKDQLGSEKSPRQIVESDSTTLELHWPGFLGIGRNQNDQSQGPLQWSDSENVRWKVELPGPGGSSPIVVGENVFVTCFSGYGLDPKNPGDMRNLQRHLLCINREDGSRRWEKTVTSAHLNEDEFTGYVALHGYASNTPVSDGRYVYTFFGKAGVFAIDMHGKEIWQHRVGTGSSSERTGSAASLVVHLGHLIVNACDESRSIIALDTVDGSEIWRATIDGMEGAFGAPAIVETANGHNEVVLSIPKSVIGLDFETGNLNWYFQTRQGESLVPTPVANKDIVYALGGYGGTNFNAIRAGGRGDVTQSHGIWSTRYSSYVPSPALHQGNLFWVNEKGLGHVVAADTGQLIQRRRMKGKFYASIVRNGPHLYATSRDDGIYVITANPEFSLVAHNKITSDKSGFLGSPAFAKSDMFVRSNSTLYCIGSSPGKLVNAITDPANNHRR